MSHRQKMVGPGPADVFVWRIRNFFLPAGYFEFTNLVQLLVSVGAFCVWANSMSSAEHLSRNNGTYAGLLLVAYTFFAPKIPMGSKS